MKKFTVLLVLFCLLTVPAFSQISFSPEINRVAVFKNGYAFTYREAETTTENGWAYTNKTPIGVLGTVWGYSTTPNVKVTQLLASETESQETERITSMVEFLLANEGALVKAEVTGGDSKTKTVQGVYEIISSWRGFKSTPPPLNTSYYESQAARINEMAIAVKTEGGVQVFAASRIESVEVIGQPKWLKPKLTKQTRLSIKTEGAAAGQKINLGVAALERGIRWIPSYRVEVKGSPIKEAKLELEAMMINELADLNKTDVYFVVGVPHFLFQDTMSPLSINTAFAGVSSFFRAGAGSNRRDSYMNVTSQISSQADGSYGSDDQNNSPAPTIGAEEQVTSFSAEQLYLYQANHISLKKGERSSLRLFSLTVPCTEVFEWTLNDDPETQKRYLEYYNSSSSQQIKQDLATKVWYALRLKNQTSMPWTTAPAITFREWKPIGQDMMTFTPTGSDNILRVTPATEVIGTHTLEEKSRERMEMKYGGSTYNFDLVTVEGKIKLKNIKKEAVEIVLTRNMVGDVISASDEGKISRQGLNLQMVNPNSIIKWNMTIPPGEKEIVYSYKIYIRR